MSSFSIGQMNQLGNGLEAAGFTADDITKLGQFADLSLIREVLHGRCRISGPELVYPDWVREHLTPELEALTVRNPGKAELWLDSRQTSGNPYPAGHEVYDALKASNLLERSLSFGDLKWYEANQDQIPAEFRGKLIYAWASVVRSAGGRLDVPCLDCSVGQPYVGWNWLGRRWRGNEPAGLRK